MSFASEAIFQPGFDGLAVYCSDGRFARQCEQFLHDGLGLSGCDCLVVPGGPGALVGHAEAAIEHTGLLADLRSLVEGHGLERLVLIAHEGCAFYAGRLGLEPQAIPAAQRADLDRAARLIRQATPGVRLEAYLAHCDEDETVQFERLALT